MRIRRDPERDGPSYPLSGRWVTLLMAMVLAQSVVVPGVAGAQSAPPKFFIEKIHVETERLSPEIVISESLLRERQEYSEAELREAVHRIHRLPFVLLAEFSLQKGSERGRYELEIRIYETRRWFFQIGGNWLLEDEITELDPRLDDSFNGRIGETVDDFRGLIGRRFALGSRGLLFASFGAEEGAFALGYQRYNLWDRNILLSLSVGGLEDIGNVTVGNSSWGARGQLGIPIRDNHALRLLLGYNELNGYFFFNNEIKSREYEAEIVWVLNSLDDPVLPREGVLIEGGLTWSDREDRRIQIRIDRQPFLQDISEQRAGLITAARRHWPVALRQSVSMGARGFFEDGEDSVRVWEAEATLGHQVFLMRRQELGKWRELRLETRASWLRQDFTPPSDVTGLVEKIDSWSLRAGLVYRNGWGLFRLTADYIDGEIQ